jgi:hypothetical protein
VGNLPSVCSTGDFDDNDDLVFAVGQLPPSSGSATFITLDTTTQGTWKGAYGAEGYAINSDVTSYPSYAQVAITNSLTYVWNQSTQDPRALQTGTATHRIASTWYSADTFTIDLNMTDGATHHVALYAVDWDDHDTRTQTVEVRDLIGTLLDRRNLSTFGNGQYLVWNLSGHVRLKVINTGPNAVVSGIFFDHGDPALPPPPSPSSGSATFIKLDAATKGTWKGTYGTEGYTVHSDVTSYPGYAQVTVSNALDYVWTQSTQDTRALQKGNAADRIASTWYTQGAFTIDLNLTDGAVHQVAFYAVDWDDNNTRTQIVEVRDTGGTLLDSRALSTFGDGQYLVWNLRGHVQIKVINTGPDAVISGIFFGPGGAVPPPPSDSATFITLDTATRGTWKGTYGADGYRIHSDVTSYPTYAQVTVSGNRDYVWNPSTHDPRALQKGNGFDRIASTWYTEGSYTIDVNLTDGAAHQVALYAVDWDDNNTRTQTVEVRDLNGALLDRRNLSAFGSGQYLVWSLRGHVHITVINTGPNAVISGIFFGPGGFVPPPPPPSGTATFIKLDTTTQGTWKSVYGTDGYTIHSDVTTYPGYAHVTVGNALDYVWNPSTLDPRALQKGNASDRIASTWYTAGTFTIDLNLTDGAAHQVAFYAVDWDDNNTRTQTVEVQDMNGTLLDSRTLNTFGNGHYLVWTLSGQVRIRVINTGPNAVISGIFFGGS